MFKSIYRFCKVMLLLVVFINSLSAQDYYNIPISSAKYFDSKSIYCSALDASGILWVGTNSGLYRFDGGQSINAKYIVEGWEELSEAYIYEMQFDQYNKLWISTKTQGLVIIDNDLLQFKRIGLTNTKGEQVFEYNIQSLGLDDKFAWATLWSGKDIQGGVLKLDLNNYSTKITPLKDVIIPGQLHHDQEDANKLWITGASLIEFNKTTSEYVEIEYDSSLKVKHLSDIFENGKSQLVIVFTDPNTPERFRTILLYDKVQKKWIRDEAVSYLDYRIYDVNMLNDSIVIITTSFDIQMQLYDTYNKVMVDWPLKKELIRSQGTIQKFKNGELVIAGYNVNYIKHVQNAFDIIPNNQIQDLNNSLHGQGYFRGSKYIFPHLTAHDFYMEFDTISLKSNQRKIDKKYNYTAMYRISETKTFAVAKDAIVTIDHNLGTAVDSLESVNVLLTIDEHIPLSKIRKSFFNSCVDSEGNVWICTTNSSVLKYNIVTEELLSFKTPLNDSGNSMNIFDVTADSEDNIYLAGRFEVFYKGSGDNEFVSLTDRFPNLKMPPNLIPYCITASNVGEFLLGTWSKGAYKINTQKSEVKRIGPEIINKNISTILPLRNDKYAILASYYIALYNNTNDEFKMLTPNHGINSDRVRYPATFSLNGRDVISLEGKFSSFNVDSLLSGQNQDIKISRIAINGNNKSISNMLSLDHHENNLVINYALQDYDVYNQVRYRYMLQPDNKDWIEVDSRKELMFANLRPEDYTLKIQSTNIDGFWIDNTSTLEINISPPWYATVWFKLLCALALLLITWALVGFYINYQKRNLEYEKRFAQLETMILKSQMNPHFIFNSLNSIRYLFMKDHKNKGLKYITKFAKLLRSTLHHGEHALVKLSDEIELTELYIELEQLRFEDKFEYLSTFDESEEWKELFIPPFVIQPLVENAFWHGLSQSDKENKELRIKIEKDKSSWLIHVEDNGVGMGNSKPSIDSEVGKKKSYGLSLIQERFELLNKTQNTEYKMKLDSTKKSGGSIITIIISPMD